MTAGCWWRKRKEHEALLITSGSRLFKYANCVPKSPEKEDCRAPAVAYVIWRFFHFPAQGGIQSGARGNTLLPAFGSTQEVTDWGEFRGPCRRVGGFQFGSQQAFSAQKTSSAKLCKFRKRVHVKSTRIQYRTDFNH